MSGYKSLKAEAARYRHLYKNGGSYSDWLYSESLAMKAEEMEARMEAYAG